MSIHKTSIWSVEAQPNSMKPFYGEWWTCVKITYFSAECKKKNQSFMLKESFDINIFGWLSFILTSLNSGFNIVLRKSEYVDSGLSVDNFASNFDTIQNICAKVSDVSGCVSDPKHIVNTYSIQNYIFNPVNWFEESFRGISAVEIIGWLSLLLVLSL